MRSDETVIMGYYHQPLCGGSNSNPDLMVGSIHLQSHVGSVNIHGPCAVWLSTVFVMYIIFGC